MRVIFLKNVDKFGKKYEVKEVRAGLARNYLIPQGLAKIATAKTLKWLKEQREKEAKKAEEELQKVGKLASQIDGLEVEIGVKIGEKGQFFEKVTGQKIAKRLKEMGYSVDKKQVELPHSIEELGEFPVKVKFDHNLESEIKVILTEETEENPKPDSEE